MFRPVRQSRTMAAGDLPRHGPGRPCKWANQAERKRAYRAPLAEDLAEPTRLRAELRQESAATRRLQREQGRDHQALERSEAALAHERAAQAQLEERIGLLTEQVLSWHRCAGGGSRRTLTDSDCPGMSRPMSRPFSQHRSHRLGMSQLNAHLQATSSNPRRRSPSSSQPSSRSSTVIDSGLTSWGTRSS
jgi:hypothetical protein